MTTRTKLTTRRVKTTRPGSIVDVRLKLEDRVKYFGLPWRTPPEQWTRADMLAVAARIAPLLKIAGPLKIDHVSWNSREGFYFQVAPQQGQKRSFVEARVHGLPLTSATTITTFSTAYGWDTTPLVGSARRARLGPSVEGPDEFRHIRMATKDGRPGAESLVAAMHQDRKSVAKRVRKAASLVRRATKGAAR
jgi:hypothetical protein